MTNLERLALLGDKEAQKECTEKEILLPCPICFGIPNLKIQKIEYGLSGTIIRCNTCGLYLYSPDKKAECTPKCVRNVPIPNHKQIAIKRWNTRQAPPIGRCEDCRYRTWFVPGYGCGNFNSPFYAAAQEDVSIMTKPDDYCSYFEPRCEE